jgi:catechol 2,3-dioxygenase-like lactoylglutathione lyase family enzyme
MADSASKLQVVGIDHVVLHVKELGRSKHFYIDLLGFAVAHEGAGRSFLRCGSQQVALFEAGDREIHAGEEMNHLALRLADGSYETVTAMLEAEGVAFFGRPGDDRCIYFDDPDGHRLQLVTPHAE